MWVVAILPLLFCFATDFTAEGMKALDGHKYQEAVGLFAKAVDADPSDYAAQFNLALSYSLLGKAAEAIPVYKEKLTELEGLGCTRPSSTWEFCWPAKSPLPPRSHICKAR